MCAAVFRAAATPTDVTRPRNFNSWQIFLSLGSPLLIGSLHVCWLAPKSFGIFELDLSLWALVLPQTTIMNPKVAKIYLILLVFYMYVKHVISTISPSSTVTKRNKGSAHGHAQESNISTHSCEVRQITIKFWGPYKLLFAIQTPVQIQHIAVSYISGYKNTRANEQQQRLSCWAINQFKL